MKKMTRAVFFDRDDTIIKNIPYLGDPSKVELMPDAAECLQRLKNAGFLLFIISNQSGVGRGLITRDQVSAVNAEMDRQLGDMFFTAKYYCYEAPDQQKHFCRKPAAKMLQQAATDFDIDLSSSFMVGDKYSDVMAGHHAGCTSLLIDNGGQNKDFAKAKAVADFTVHGLLQAAAVILQHRA